MGITPRGSSYGFQLSQGSTNEISVEMIRTFFDELIQKLEEDKTAMILGTADEAKTRVIERMILGEKEVIYQAMFHGMARNILQDIFIDYSKAILSSPNRPKEIAFSLSAFTVNVFAIIKDDDKEASKNLILSEADIISKYHQQGFRINTMFFEESEEVSIPSNYKSFPFENKNHK